MEGLLLRDEQLGKKSFFSFFLVRMKNWHLKMSFARAVSENQIGDISNIFLIQEKDRGQARLLPTYIRPRTHTHTHYTIQILSSVSKS